MIIDTINISQFKMTLLKLEGFHDLPARKKILKEPGTQDKDIKREAKEIRVKLLGRYNDAADMLSCLNDFQTLLKSQLKHAIAFIGHDSAITGTFNQGYESKEYYGGKIIVLTIPITITQ